MDPYVKIGDLILAIYECVKLVYSFTKYCKQ